MKTNVMIQKVLLYKIQQCCVVDMPPPHIPCNELGEVLTDAVADQHDLGWDNMVKGRISKKWGLAQEIHIKIFDPKFVQHAKKRWEKELIWLLWNCFYHIWASCNRALHNLSHDPNSTSMINKQIRKAYSKLQHQMDSYDQQLFNKSLNEQLDMTPQSKQH
eukprot:12956650-Ditylum_brightwellii.AAC.1